MQLTASPDRFAISVVGSPYGSPTRLRLRAVGEVDLATAPVLRAALFQALETPNLATLELELDGVTFLDAQGVSALLQAVVRAGKVGGRLRLLRPQAYIRRVLDITGVSTVCDVE